MRQIQPDLLCGQLEAVECLSGQAFSYDQTGTRDKAKSKHQGQQSRCRSEQATPPNPAF
jgi:hypothetical protein